MKYQVTFNSMCDAEMYEHYVLEAPRDDYDTIFRKIYDLQIG